MGDPVNRNYIFDNVNDALPILMRALLNDGEEFGSRAGKTKELTFVGITLERPWQREIISPVRKANVAAQIVETMWVLAGRNDVGALIHYLPRAGDFSDNGQTWRAGYGPRLRNYQGVDQLAYVVDTLKANPSSRQAVATIWEPTTDTSPGKDIACNNWLSFSSRHGELDLMVGIRSNDAMWGWSGINAFEWSVLLEVVAGLAGLEVGKLHFATTSFHLYEQHWTKAEKLAQEYHQDEFKDSSRFSMLRTDGVKEFDELTARWFNLERRIRTGQSVGQAVADFPEPMLRSWLRVLQWYWSGDESLLDNSVGGTRLAEACRVGLKPPGAPQENVPEEVQCDLLKPKMLDHVNALHAEKHAAYGDSWKRRGEPGILGNIARKVDRIGSGVDTSDETQADTAQDLLVYLAKYWCWLEGFEGNPDEVAVVFDKCRFIDYSPDFNKNLDWLFNLPAGPSESKRSLVRQMLDEAYTYAVSLW
jgi:thymidylate synthase